MFKKLLIIFGILSAYQIRSGKPRNSAAISETPLITTGIWHKLRMNC